MRKTSRRTILLLGLAAASWAAAARAAELKKVENPAAGFSIGLPQGWRSIPLPTGLIGMAAERNERGQPVVTLNVSQPDLAGKSFAALLEEERARVERMSKPGDEHQLATLEHAAGPAFRTTRRTTTNSGQVQAVQAVYLEAGGKVWLLNWVVPPSDEPDRFEELSLAVVESFSVE